MRNTRELLSACQRAITAMLEAEAKATPGPWYQCGPLSDEESSTPGGVPVSIVVDGDPDDVDEEYGYVLPREIISLFDHEPDAALTCTARNLHRPMLELAAELLADCDANIKAYQDTRMMQYKDAAAWVNLIARIIALDETHGGEVRKLLEVQGE